MKDMEPISVEFLLRGEWMAANAPGTKVPSHGTDDFGQTYAYDFIGVDPGQKSLKFLKKGNLDYLLGRVRLNDFYGWGNSIFAPFSSTVVEASDGYTEGSINLLSISSLILKNIVYNLEKASIQN